MRATNRAGIASGPADYAAVRKIQNGFGLTSLSYWGGEPPVLGVDPWVIVILPDAAK